MRTILSLLLATAAGLHLRKSTALETSEGGYRRYMGSRCVIDVPGHIKLFTPISQSKCTEMCRARSQKLDEVVLPRLFQATKVDDRRCDCVIRGQVRKFGQRNVIAVSYDPMIFKKKGQCTAKKCWLAYKIRNGDRVAKLTRHRDVTCEPCLESQCNSAEVRVYASGKDQVLTSRFAAGSYHHRYNVQLDIRKIVPEDDDTFVERPVPPAVAPAAVVEEETDDEDVPEIKTHPSIIPESELDVDLDGDEDVSLASDDESDTETDASDDGSSDSEDSEPVPAPVEADVDVKMDEIIPPSEVEQEVEEVSNGGEKVDDIGAPAAPPDAKSSYDECFDKCMKTADAGLGLAMIGQCHQACSEDADTQTTPAPLTSTIFRVPVSRAPMLGSAFYVVASTTLESRLDASVSISRAGQQTVVVVVASTEPLPADAAKTVAETVVSVLKQQTQFYMSALSDAGSSVDPIPVETDVDTGISTPIVEPVVVSTTDDLEEQALQTAAAESRLLRTAESWKHAFRGEFCVGAVSDATQLNGAIPMANCDNVEAVKRRGFAFASSGGTVETVLSYVPFMGPSKKAVYPNWQLVQAGKKTVDTKSSWQLKAPGAAGENMCLAVASSCQPQSMLGYAASYVFSRECGLTIERCDEKSKRQQFQVSMGGADLLDMFWNWRFLWAVSSVEFPELCLTRKCPLVGVCEDAVFLQACKGFARATLSVRDNQAWDLV